MRWSAKQFRWLTLGGALVLAGILAAMLGLSRYRAGKVWQRILARHGVNLVQESNGITYSQSVGGRTVFTLHAERSTPHGNGLYSLHNAVLILYGKNGRDDRIRGSDFEYDQSQGILRAVGEVHMDLQAPEPAGAGKTHTPPPTSFSFAPEDDAALDPSVIHVRTSGLVFLRKLEVAATKEPVEFSYRGIRCNSVGAEFDSGQSMLHLLAEVQMTGTLQSTLFHLTAAHADLDRNANTVALERADWTSEDRAAKANHTLLTLRKDGSLEHGEGEGDVVLRSASRVLAAPRAQADFGADNKPQHAVFTGGVDFADRAPESREHGTASTLTLVTDAKGVLRSAVAEGGVQLRTEQGIAGQQATAQARSTRDVQAQQAVATFADGMGEGERRPQTGPRESSRAQPVLTNLKLQGGAQLLVVAGGDAKDAGTRTSVRAEELTTSFTPRADRTVEPEHATGLGHTVLEQAAPDGRRQVSEGDRLEAEFAARSGGGAGPGPAGVQSAVQSGHVVLHTWPAAAERGRSQGVGNPVQGQDQPSVGRADRAVYQAAEGTLLLASEGAGRAEWSEGGTQMSAPRITLHQGTGDGEAEGGVVVTSSGEAPGAAASHVTADRAKLLHATDVAEFFGSNRVPAQLWQGSSQVSAANLVLDGRRHTLTARPEAAGGVVHGLFAAEHAGVGGTAPHGSTRPVVAPAGSSALPLQAKTLAMEKDTEAGRDAMRVTAEALDYNDEDRQAVLRGHVVVRGTEGVMSGDRGVAFFEAPQAGTGKAESSGGRSGAQKSDKAGILVPAAGTAPGSAVAPPGAAAGIGGRLERFVLLGDVHLQQPGRSGLGRELTYTAASDRFVLTGTAGMPPRVVDAQQGTVTGETLLFGATDKSVVVAGEARSGTPSAGPGRRVHTEGEIKQ